MSLVACLGVLLLGISLGFLIAVRLLRDDPTTRDAVTMRIPELDLLTSPGHRVTQEDLRRVLEAVNLHVGAYSYLAQRYVAQLREAS